MTWAANVTVEGSVLRLNIRPHAVALDMSPDAARHLAACLLVSAEMAEAEIPVTCRITPTRVRVEAV